MSRYRQDVGAGGEEAAVRHLQEKGYIIECRNYRCFLGELDIVARDGSLLVFVEVRSRSVSGFGAPAESITKAKQRRLRKLALHYLVTRYKKERTCRFDLITVETSADGNQPRISHLVNILT